MYPKARPGTEPKKANEMSRLGGEGQAAEHRRAQPEERSCCPEVIRPFRRRYGLDAVRYRIYTVSIRPKFEYDEAKSRANQAKHGIGFVEAQALWSGPVLDLRSKHADEPRKLVIGRIGDRFWTAIVTERGNKVRIISVRRSRSNEEKRYKEVKANNS